MTSLRKQIGTLFIVGFEGTQPPQELLESLGRAEIGGVILFSRNIETLSQLRRMNDVLHRAVPSDHALIVSVDQEGGRVQRIKAPLPHWPPMRHIATCDDEKLTEAVGRAIGDDLRLLGFNLDYAPVLDVVSSEINTVIGDRAFGSDAERAARHALAFARGLESAGVLWCGKHFPGHGGPVSDSHYTLPVEKRSREALESVDLVPFRAAIRAHAPMLMTAHVKYEALDPEQIGTFSSRICHSLLREQLGFKGVLVSDDLEMAAVSEHASMAHAAVSAINAGADMILICRKLERYQEAFQGLIDEATQNEPFRRRIEEAYARVQKLTARLQPCPTISPDEVSEILHTPRHTELLKRLEAKLRFDS